MMDNHQAPGMNSRRNRNSILQSAGDALGFRLNKRKRMSTISSHGQSPSYTDSHSKHGPSIFDDVVLEISANGNNGFYPQPTVVEYAEDDSAEREARERLRDAAAQAVGLPQANTNANVYSASTTVTNGATHYNDTPIEHRPTPARTHSGKSRGSMMKTAGTTTGSGLPRYPGTLSSMQSHVQNAAILQKFNPSPSPFLILSRSRQWKTRYIAITSIEQKFLRRTESHLHLFKSGALDDRELERIRIHTNSVVYVADEEVGGGRQFVLKIGGMAVDAGSKDIGPTTWLLQMPDSIQMQRWIQIVKNAVLLQKAEQDGPVAEVYHNTYGNARQERKSDTDMPASAKRRQSFGPATGLPMANTIDSGIDNINTGIQVNGNPTTLGAVSALNRLWNNRPTSRQLSVSGSSIATAFATPSLNSQASVHAAIVPPPPTTQPPTVPSETEPPAHEVVPSKSRESMLYNLFRPTSPPIPTHQQQQPSITHMSPPISPTVSLPFTEDTVTSQSSTIATRFSPNGSGRHAHHSSSFSVDWDAIDGGSLGVINPKRNNPILQTALAPPPRRRPLTGGGLSQRQPSPPKEVVEEEQNMSPSPAAIVRPLPIPFEDAQRSFESEDGGDVTMETALRGQGGQRSYFDDEDDEELEDHEHELGMVQDITTEYRAPLDLSPMSAHSHGHDEVESQRSAHLPSPLQRPNLALSSASSFGAAGSVKTAMHEHGSLGSRDDLITEEDHREGGEIDGNGDPVNQFHLPTGRRRSRLSSVPRQLSPPTGPPPPIPMPMFHSPPFPALSSPPHDYSGSERPGSSSSIPSTVPSMQAGGLSSLLSKRISTMSSEAPSIKSTESSGGGSMNNSKLVGSSSYATGSSRLSVIPGPLGPRSSAFPPPRPAPNVAPPPAPLDDLSSIGGHHRLSLSSFGKGGPASPSSRSGGGGSGSASSRSEFVNRLTRYSVGPAGPPPTAALPPTPLVIGDADVSMSSAGGYSQALPRNSMSSFSSNGQSNIGSILFTIPASPATGKASPNSSLPLPAMAPLPIRPLPPTPHLISADDAERRPVSPSGLSTTSNRSSRSASALPFARMSSLKQRLRMMSNPTPIRGEEGDALVSIPPAHPPPNFPLPETPYQARQTKSQSQQYINYSEISRTSENGYNHVHAHAHSYSTTPPPITPLGEAITSRLDQFPFGPGASTAQIASIPSGLASASSPGATSPGSTMSFASRALRTAMTPTSPPDITPLSPPPRRNSRASRDLTPAERERWKVVVAGLEEESGKAVTPYESVPAKHSAINLPSFAD